LPARTICLPLLWNSNVAGENGSEQGEVAAVAVDGLRRVLALLGVAVEEHVVEQHLCGQHGQLLLRRDLAQVLLVELDAEHIKVRAELDGHVGRADGSLLDDGGNVARASVRIEERHGEVETEAHFGPSTKEAGAGDFAEGRGVVGSVAELDEGDATAAEDGLRGRPNEGSSSSFRVRTTRLFGVVGDGSRVEVDAILAAGEAHEGAEPLAGRLAAAALAVVADNGEQHRVALVELAHGHGVSTWVARISSKVRLNVRRQVVEVVKAKVSGQRDVLSDLELERVVWLAAAAIPVIRHLVHTQHLDLAHAVSRVDTVCVFLGDGRALAALLGQQLDVLADGEDIGRVDDGPELRGHGAALQLLRQLDGLDLGEHGIRQGRVRHDPSDRVPGLHDADGRGNRIPLNDRVGGVGLGNRVAGLAVGVGGVHGRGAGLVGVVGHGDRTSVRATS
jgi:hypothetical protein